MIATGCLSLHGLTLLHNTIDNFSCSLNCRRFPLNRRSHLSLVRGRGERLPRPIGQACGLDSLTGPLRAVRSLVLSRYQLVIQVEALSTVTLSCLIVAVHLP